MTQTPFQRARSEDQKAERTTALLAAARALLDIDPDPRRLSLADLAVRAGMVKSNVYRYFDSREAVLLALLAEDTHAWADACCARLAEIDAAAPTDARLTAMITAIGAETDGRPRLCHLLSVLPSVLEHNVGVDAIVTFKRDVAGAQGPLVAAMHTRVPELPLPAHAELLRFATSFVVGTWHLSHPSAAGREALAQPDLRAFAHHFLPDLTRAMTLMGRGLLAELR